MALEHRRIPRAAEAVYFRPDLAAEDKLVEGMRLALRIETAHFEDRLQAGGDRDPANRRNRAQAALDSHVKQAEALLAAATVTS